MYSIAQALDQCRLLAGVLKEIRRDAVYTALWRPVFLHKFCFPHCQESHLSLPSGGKTLNHDNAVPQGRETGGPMLVAPAHHSHNLTSETVRFYLIKSPSVPCYIIRAPHGIRDDRPMLI